MDKKYIACDVCGKSFESYDSRCQKCEFYHEGLDSFGETKSKLDYQIEAGLEGLLYMVEQIKGANGYK